MRLGLPTFLCGAVGLEAGAEVWGLLGAPVSWLAFHHRSMSRYVATMIVLGAGSSFTCFVLRVLSFLRADLRTGVLAVLVAAVEASVTADKGTVSLTSCWAALRSPHWAHASSLASTVALHRMHVMSSSLSFEAGGRRRVGLAGAG